MLIRCEIVSQDRLVFEGDAEIVIVPGSLGEMGIMPGHAPLLSTLELGVIRVKNGDLEDVFTVTGGFIEVQPDIVTIMADAAENVEDIDVRRAEEAMERASNLLEKDLSTDPDTYMKIGNLVAKDIREMNDYVKENEIKIAVLAIPAEYAHDVIDDLVNAGITAILNYAPIYIKTPEGVQIEHIDPAVHLQKLSYFIK